MADVSSSVGEVTLSKEEASLYDRQIRLWGLDAQKRLRSARVLLVGLRGLGAEVAKNITLAGVHSMTLMDDSVVTEEDACSQFLVHRSDVGKNRAVASEDSVQKLNRMVAVTSEAASPSDKEDTYFTNFDVICVTGASRSQLVRIDKICREHNIKFFAGDVYGFYGFMFADLGTHEFAEEIERPVAPRSDGDGGPPPPKKGKVEMETITQKRTSEFCALEQALGVNWSGASAKTLKRTPKAYFMLQVLQRFEEAEGRKPQAASAAADRQLLLRLRDEVLPALGLAQDRLPDAFASSCCAELGPVCAIVGGVLGQEVIKALSQKDPPHNNFFFYDGVEGSGLVDSIGSSA